MTHATPFPVKALPVHRRLEFRQRHLFAPSQTALRNASRDPMGSKPAEAVCGMIREGRAGATSVQGELPRFDWPLSCESSKQSQCQNSMPSFPKYPVTDSYRIPVWETLLLPRSSERACQGVSFFDISQTDACLPRSRGWHIHAHHNRLVFGGKPATIPCHGLHGTAPCFHRTSPWLSESHFGKRRSQTG